ncbi:hypothetical protein MOBT1_000211 [Malassezia obtusa]|uniref:Uncharacterized protein n=1 Tax=Malassezia obtusa TaxID=76774 RepID=A0AAF0E1Q6_9BASI|nr:hypothetical protein MOBT1_000211 [Malassezia obtusa]
MTTPAITLSLSGAERQAFGQLFALADPGQSGVITGDAAVKFFEGFKLPTFTLGQIWAIADSSNNGFLTPNAFAVALRLIARAQRGESIGEAETQIQGAPPVYEGPGAPIPGAGVPAEATIKPEDKARFSRIFATVGPTNGLLSGDQAKEVFMKSKLPFAKLGAIWNLADTKARGALDLTDFVIGMYYIQGTMNGTISTIPATLPPGLYEQASGAPTPPLQPQRTGTDHLAAAFGLPPAKPAPAPAPPRAQTPRSMAASRSSSYASVRTPGDWAITPQEKAKFDSFFDSLDTGKTGAIEGAMVVPFFMQSGLDEPTLAHVWDLSDLTQNGQLSRDEFAVAMRLINDKLEGKPLPEQLPPTYMPPSMRSHDLPEAVDVKQTETQKELFSLLDTDAPVMSPSVAATAFSGGGAPGGAPGAREAPAPAPAPVPAPAPSAPAARAPPAPASNAGSAAPSRSATAFNAFDDDFDAPTPVSSGADVGNAQNALDSTNRSLDDLKTRRATAESTAARNATSLKELEAQLARARSEHETENAAVRELEERVKAQATELDTLRQDVIRTESELSATRTQKDELEQKLMQDREALRETKRQLAELQAETAQLREEKERIAKEARQHAGLAAIASKQLASAHDEHEAVRAISTEPVPEPDAMRATPAVPVHDAARAASSSTTPGAATPGGTRFNPFEAFTASGAAPVEEPRSVHDTFESQYGSYGEPEPSAVPAAPAAPESSEDDEGPEDVGARPHGRGAAAPDVPLGGTDEAYTGLSAAVPAPKESMSLPGGFPGEADVETSRESAPAPTAGAAAGGAPVPPPTEPLVPPPATQPPPSINKVERAPTSWSTSATVASTPAATPGARPTSGAGPTPSEMWAGQATPSAKAPSGLDDFDSAFANLGLAHVVHNTQPAGQAPPASFDVFEENFGSSITPETPKSSAPPMPSAAGAPPVPSRPAGGAPGAGADRAGAEPAAPSAPAAQSMPVPAPGAAPAPSFASPLSYLSSTTIAPRADGANLPGLRKAQDPTQGDAYGATSGRPPVVIGSAPSSASATSPSDGPAGTPIVTSVPPPAAGAPPSASTPSVPPPGASGAASGAPSGAASGGAPGGGAPGGAPGGARAPSPSLPDDVGPVRQLCQMGFSRSQVVRALERCGYRTERALEHLLSNSGRA